jgi:hypothetical protein
MKSWTGFPAINKVCYWMFCQLLSIWNGYDFIFSLCMAARNTFHYMIIIFFLKTCQPMSFIMKTVPMILLSEIVLPRIFIALESESIFSIRLSKSLRSIYISIKDFPIPRFYFYFSSF